MRQRRQLIFSRMTWQPLVTVNYKVNVEQVGDAATMPICCLVGGNAKAHSSRASERWLAMADGMARARDCNRFESAVRRGLAHELALEVRLHGLKSARPTVFS
jgi:hypothetical protein